MLLKTKVHTIFLMIGPTECGKSTFAEKVLVPGLSFHDPDRNFRMNVQVVSSDQIRRELLGYSYDKHDAIMMEASVQVFDLLERKIEALTSFPIHAEFIIVDTKGLSEEFRSKIRDIAQRNHYQVEAIVFDYRNSKDYYIEGTKSKDLVSRDLRRLRTEVVPNLRKEGYHNIHRIKAKNFLDENGNASSDYVVQIENLDAYLKTILPVNKEYFIVGDIHEEVNAFKKLLQDKGFIIENDQMVPTPKTENTIVVLVGDFIDKGKNTKEMISFLHKNRKYIRVVKGNHENFVYKYLKGMLKDVEIPQGMIEKHFTSMEVLQNDEALRNQFFELVEDSVEHLRYIGVSDGSFYVTHAPCPNKYLGKIDSVSLTKQRNFRLNREQDIEEQLQFVQKEAVGNHPFHVFGHIASQDGFRLKNKVCIDTGAVYGNRLLGVSIHKGRLYFKSVKTISKEQTEQLPVLFGKKQATVSIDDLSDEDRRRLQYVLRNKINFISGTISPADKNEKTGELESLEAGLEYFKAKGLKKVCMQPKYMGSRCTIYLGHTVDECYAVSRNGYKIKNVDLEPVYANLIKKHQAMMQKDGIRMMVIDGELMPWMVLGKGLIEKQFRVIDVALREEIQFLKEYGFEEKLLALNEVYVQSDFSKDQSHLSKKELVEKYGEALYNQLKHVKDAMKHYVPLSQHEEAYLRYHDQVELYGADGEIHFKPFDVLKFIYDDGSEKIPSEPKSVLFSLVSDDEYLVVDFNDPDYLKKADAFYKTLTTDRKMEGVVIKPEVEKAGVASAIKVRNPEYLRIIYGYDYTFPHKYQSLFAQKNIEAKLQTSINEYELGKQMLAFPLHSIVEDNREYAQVVANMLFETSKGAEIDPRL